MRGILIRIPRQRRIKYTGTNHSLSATEEGKIVCGEARYGHVYFWVLDIRLQKLLGQRCRPKRALEVSLPAELASGTRRSNYEEIKANDCPAISVPTSSVCMNRERQRYPPPLFVTSMIKDLTPLAFSLLIASTVYCWN